MARTNNFLLMAIKRPERIQLPDLTLVEDGFVAEIGGRSVRYRHAPGHTPGSCTIAVGDHLFTGDTLYSRGIGLSKLPGENHRQLRETILGLLPDLPRFQVHPGHGPSSPGADLLERNPALRAFLGSGPESASVWDGSDVKAAM
jgi:glyoxylase-like metal-dependent hydrolase (beta-lactamase superfamily II)